MNAWETDKRIIEAVFSLSCSLRDGQFVYDNTSRIYFIDGEVDEFLDFVEVMSIDDGFKYHDISKKLLKPMFYQKGDKLEIKNNSTGKIYRG